MRAGKIFSIPFLALISLWQICISPYLGAHCRFSPTCSEYTKLAIKEHGVFRGLWLGAKRILKCNPYSKLEEREKLDLSA